MKANSNNEVRKNNESERKGINGDSMSYKGIMQMKGKDKINNCKPSATQTSIV